jgi:hypothetical protein
MKNRVFNKVILAAAVISAVLVAGCKKFLDQQPISELGPEMVFSDVASTQKALAGVYSRLIGDQGYGIRVSLYYPVDNDEMQGPSGAADNDRRDMARYSLTSSNAQLERPFNQLFQGIEYANICIDNIPEMALYSSGTEQQKKQLQRMLGEALTLRAQFYLEAIRNWGDLPAHFEPAYVQASGTPFPRRTSADTLYERVIADLKTAEDLVPWRNEVTSIGDQLDERITKGTVKGLRARIALFRGGYRLRQTGGTQRSADYLTYYQVARDEANEVITSGQHSLNPSFRLLWKDQVGARTVVDPNGELMFQVTGIGGGSAADTKLGYYNGPRVGTFGNSSINPLPTYFYLFDSTDLRRDVTIAPYNNAADGVTKVGQAITALNDGKYRRDWISNPVVAPTNAAQYFQTKWQILRYADVLLMFAEAENEINGPTPAAYNALNMVRRRGYGKPVATADPSVDIPAGLTKTDFFKAVIRERALELGGEGIRKYDLMRWNLLGTSLTESRDNMTRMSNVTAIVNPTYMAPYPAYVTGAVMPIAMYYKNSNTSDDKNLWYNSFYVTAPTSTPAGTTKVNWLTSAITTSLITGRYASGFTPGKSELFPIPQPVRDANSNMTQNPGY